MNKRVCVGLILVAVISLAVSGLAYSQTKAKSIILTTMDVPGPYEVVNLVSYRSNSTDINELIKGLKKVGEGLGADAVIGVHCASYADYFYAYGTAVKFKK